jgi:hypothetical protein
MLLKICLENSVSEKEKGKRKGFSPSLSVLACGFFSRRSPALGGLLAILFFSAEMQPGLLPSSPAVCPASPPLLRVSRAHQHTTLQDLCNGRVTLNTLCDKPKYITSNTMPNYPGY